MIKDTKEWADSLRETLQLPETPLQQRNGQWRLRDRRTAWFAAGPRIFDHDLDRLESVAVEVLTERDPQFDLDPDSRFAAGVRGKVLKHSSNLRDGLAETLALLGALPEALINTSFGKAQTIAAAAVHEILYDADWQIWAGLSGQLPLLAEAAPEMFMGMVEHSLEKSPSPFIDVYRQEGGGVFGRSYITGLLWALESLAWSDEFLTRVVVILGNLAAVDPGGQWANRPSNSLVEILLPWLPHTTAKPDQRINAVKALIKNRPEVGWNLLLSLLPSSHQTSSETHKPTWRNWIPDTWKRGVTNQEYWEQSETYAGLAVEYAAGRSRIQALVKRVADIPPKIRQQFLHKLRAEKNLTSDERQSVWSELLTIIARHKKYSTAEWAMPQEQVAELETVAHLFKPASPALEFKRLFGRGDHELRDEKLGFEENERRLEEKRIKAAEAIFADGGIEAIIAYSHEVNEPWRLGWAVGRSSISAEADFLPAFLADAASPESNLARGFTWGRFYLRGWEWVDQLGTEAWSDLHRAQLLAILPFGEATWTRAENSLPDQGRLFWLRTDANPYRAQTGLNHAILRLLENGRPLEAVACLYYQIHKPEQIDEKLAVRTLLELLEKQDQLGRSRDLHDVIDIIKALQTSAKVSPDDLLRIEWSYLPLLDRFSGGSPVYLSKRLATDPAFFCEIIRLLYRSKDQLKKKAEEIDERRKRVAELGYKLLHNWHRPPGRNDDGTFDPAALQSWIYAVEKSCAESGHLEIALTHVGHVLKYAPPDPSGLWIHKAAAEVLNAENADDARSGYSCEWFNSRGAHFGSGGQEELKLAAAFKQKASEVEAEGFVRLGTTLRELARDYERQAAREASNVPFDT
ncbi:MAG TPA: hypothetical protein VFT72_20205 [Opitutaceae bacterium]|nr:hypothetical protein [Opitutaceae bacterium]